MREQVINVGLPCVIEYQMRDPGSLIGMLKTGWEYVLKQAVFAILEYLYAPAPILSTLHIATYSADVSFVYK